LLEDSEYELARRKKAMLEDVNKDIVKLIQQIGKKENYSLILEVTGGNVIYANESYDLTQRIVEDYDKATSKK